MISHRFDWRPNGPAEPQHRGLGQVQLGENRAVEETPVRLIVREHKIVHRTYWPELCDHVLVMPSRCQVEVEAEQLSWDEKLLTGKADQAQQTMF